MQASIVTQTTSDHLSLVRQLGLLDYAQTVARHHVIAIPEA